MPSRGLSIRMIESIGIAPDPASTTSVAPRQANVPFCFDPSFIVTTTWPLIATAQHDDDGASLVCAYAPELAISSSANVRVR